MEKNKNNSSLDQSLNASEKDLDLFELAMKLWLERMFIIKSIAVAVFIGLVVAFSIPKEYTTTVKLSPEMSSKENRMGGLGALAGMAGINLGSSGGPDALSPQLYPDIVSSVQFTTELFDIHVESKDKKIRTSIYNYLLNEQKVVWWSLPFEAISKMGNFFRGEKKSEISVRREDFYDLTLDEMKVVKELRKRMNVMVEKKSSLIKLSIKMQDPFISASLTDSVMLRLQNYIKEYRTKKARQDLENTHKMYREAQENYYNSQKKYALYLDRNQNISMQSFKTESERLENEKNLAFNLYNQMAQQLQMAELKVQENTPVFAVVEAICVPLKPSLSKKIILAGFVFLGCLFSFCWILFMKNFKDEFYDLKKCKYTV